MSDDQAPAPQKEHKEDVLTRVDTPGLPVDSLTASTDKGLRRGSWDVTVELSDYAYGKKYSPQRYGLCGISRDEGERLYGRVQAIIQAEFASERQPASASASSADAVARGAEASTSGPRAEESSSSDLPLAAAPAGAAVPRYLWTQHGMQRVGYPMISYPDVEMPWVRAADHDAALVDALAKAHGAGQEHAIADVNAGLVDDMIQPRLDALLAAAHRVHLAALTAVHQRIAQLEQAVAGTYAAPDREQLVADLSFERAARHQAEQRVAETKPCVICGWPQPSENDYEVCACCGFEPLTDEATDYPWNGQWWSTTFAPPLLVQQLQAALTTALRERDAERIARVQAEYDRDRLLEQAVTVSVTLSDAGCSAMPIPDGVRWLVLERDREKARTDIVIAEFDAPWPHSHTVAEQLANRLVKQIHDCRAGTENRADAALRERDEAREERDHGKVWWGEWRTRAEIAERRAEAAERTGAALRDALGWMIGLHDDPTPYDSATTITVARKVLKDALARAGEPVTLPPARSTASTD